MLIQKTFNEIVNDYKVSSFEDLSKNSYDVYFIPKSKNDKDVFALMVLSNGSCSYNNIIGDKENQYCESFDIKNSETMWFTKYIFNAEKLLKDNSYYIIYKNNKPYGYFSSNIKDNADNFINYMSLEQISVLAKPFFEIDRELIKKILYYKKANKLYDFVEKTNTSGEIWFKNLNKEYINNEKDIRYIYNFCLRNKIRINEKEFDIVNELSVEDIVEYASICIKGRFDEKNNERKIAEEKIFSSTIENWLKYTRFCIKDRLPIENGIREKLEKEIIKNVKNIGFYTNFCIKDRWPNENEIRNKIEKIIINDPISSVYYAIYSIKGRWPEENNLRKIAEEIISKDAISSYFYSLCVLKGDRFPNDNGFREEAEKNMANNMMTVLNYARDCIKGRWPEDNLRKIAEDNLIKKGSYSSDYASFAFIDKNGKRGDRWPKYLRKMAEKNIMKDKDAIDYYLRFSIKSKISKILFKIKCYIFNKLYIENI